MKTVFIDYDERYPMVSLYEDWEIGVKVEIPYELWQKYKEYEKLEDDLHEEVSKYLSFDEYLKRRNLARSN